MSYKKLKQDTLNAFLEVKNMTEREVNSTNIVKSEVLDDLMRFMVFFEELERKENNHELKKKEHKDSLKKIKKYINLLNEMLLDK